MERALNRANNHITAAPFTYDGDGHRVQKSNGKLYWYAGGEIIEESDASGNMQQSYVFLDGKRVANRVVSSGAISYYAEDFIGSSRVITTSAGATCYDADFYPYGAESNVTNTCAQNYKWTGKERDAETGNDDFDARYYSSTYGRFLSADWSAVPAPVPYANLTNPQTLNLYAIVRDNPESYADLDGHLIDPGQAAPCGDEHTGCGGTNQNTAANTPGQNAGQGAAISAGASLTNDAAVRANYAQQAGELSGSDASAARTALQQDAYQQLSPVGKAVTDVLKQSRTGQLVGKTAAELAESASTTNAAVNAAGGAAKVAGPALLVVGAGVSAYNIASAPAGQRGRVAAGEAGAWTGALTGGALGAKAGAVVGSFFGPGPGTAIGAGVGALVGGGVGAIAGSHLGRAIYDWF